MRYGESSHEAKEFDDDEIEDYSQEIVKIKPKRPSNIPNGLAMLKQQDFRINLPDTGKIPTGFVHNSMPPTLPFPATMPTKSLNVKSISHDSLAALRPKPGEIFFGKKNKKLI